MSGSISRGFTVGALLFGALMIAVSGPALAVNNALRFDGSTDKDFVSFGADTLYLGLKTFTLEVWFYRTAAGTSTSTGTGGVTNAVPLLTKGRGEADAADRRDMNYFLGIRISDNVLVADYEEGRGQTSPSLNHPIVGVTPIQYNAWYHAAVTFDGSVMRLYLNGNLEAEVTGLAGRLPRWDSSQYAALASAMQSTGTATADGFFVGVLDEARVWNRARTQQAIADSMGMELTSGPGLRARWGLNQTSGTSATNSISGSPAGTLQNSPAWVPGFFHALKLGSSNAYVTFRNPAQLGLPRFTVETWFKRDGTGTAITTGSGGLMAYPLVTHGAAEADGDRRDMDFFVGIRSSDNVLCADFEEGSGGAHPGLNHPIAGATQIVNGQWYHAAATYDGTTWRLYLNGALENELYVGQPTQDSTLQYMALGTSIKTDSTANGFFNGTLDEVRVWNYSRTVEQIDSTVNGQIRSTKSGLVARWGLDEPSGTIVRSTAGATLPGSIKGSGSSWVDAAPFNAVPNPQAPTAPSALSAVAMAYVEVDLAWTDNSNNELSFELERSTAGSGGPFSAIDTLPPNTTSFVDVNINPGVEYCYRVRAHNIIGNSNWSNIPCATTPTDEARSLDFGGGNGYVTFGRPSALNLAQFTLECWFRRDSVGTTANTGNGGIIAVPLVTKGNQQTDGDRRDMNYFMGIRGTDSVLCADFEDVPAGVNHPVVGATPIATGRWYHAAATYDGTTWRLYLDGTLEAELAAGATPQSQSYQHAGLAVAMDTSGAPSGHFNGLLDEVRIWNYARTKEEIRSAINAQIATSQTGLVARWSLNEGAGTKVYGSAGTAVMGTIKNSGWSWAGPAPFDIVYNDPPEQPALNAPANGATHVSRSPSLDVTVSDPDADALDVTFYGRSVENAPGRPFTIIILPDALNYTAQLNGGSATIFYSQTQWIASHIDSLNIAYANQIGDCSNDGDSQHIQWERAWSAMSLLEDTSATHLPQGLPYGVCVGNRDQTPAGSATGTTNYYNEFFGAAHFGGRPYYGGHYGSNSDNNFDLFSAGGLSFIVISLEYNTNPGAAVVSWADSLLKAHPNRRGIVCCHSLIGTGDPGAFSTEGLAIYNGLRENPNLFLMLCGNTSGEGLRTDVYQGHTVHTLLADYQGRPHGGDGWLRIMKFYPADNMVRVQTYSPTLDSLEADADSSSQFTLSCDLQPLGGWVTIGTVSDVASGAHAVMTWPGLNSVTEYEWYTTVSDAAYTATGPTWHFTTSSNAPTALLSYPNGGEHLTAKLPINILWSALDDAEVTAIDLLLSRTGVGGPYIPIATGVANTGAYSWTVDSVATTDAYVKVVAYDGEGQTGVDVSDGAFAIVVPTDVDAASITRLSFEMSSAHPFQGSGAFSLAIPRQTTVRLSVYDVSGRRVGVLVDAVYQPGRYRIGWNGTTARGRVASGVYFMRLEACGQAINRKIVIVK